MKKLCIAYAVCFAFCAHMPPAKKFNGIVMPVNFECFVNQNIDGTGRCVAYRGGQPTETQLVAMDATYDVKLNVPSLMFDGPHDSLPASVEEYHHPWSPVGPVGHDDTLAALFDLERAIETVRAAGHGVVYVHCTHGCDRTGYLVAVYRVLVEHVLPSSAWAEWRRFPRERSDGLFYADFKRETGYTIPENER
jgi:hypothetical protein